MSLFGRKRPVIRKSLVGFVVGEAHYAVDLHRVKEITPPHPMAPPPQGPPPLIGMAQRREGAVPVICLRTRFGMPSATQPSEQKWLYIRTQATLVAIVVDSVTGVFGPEPGAQKARPDTAMGNHPASAATREVVYRDDEICFVLDIDRVIAIERALVPLVPE